VNAEALKWAVRQSAGGVNEKGVLLALAILADDDGLCVTSRARLADLTEQPRRAVERALQTLEANGFIARGSKGETTDFRLLTTRQEARP